MYMCGVGRCVHVCEWVGVYMCVGWVGVCVYVCMM